MLVIHHQTGASRYQGRRQKMVNHPNRSKLYSDHTGTTYSIISREDLPNGDAILSLTRGTKLRHLIERSPKDSPAVKDLVILGVDFTQIDKDTPMIKEKFNELFQ